MIVQPVVLDDGSLGYREGSIANYNEGLFYAVRDAFGDPQTEADAWVQIASLITGPTTDAAIYTATAVLAGGIPGVILPTDGKQGEFGVANETQPDFAAGTFWGSHSDISQISQRQSDGSSTQIYQDSNTFAVYMQTGSGPTDEVIYAAIDPATKQVTFRLMGAAYGGGADGNVLTEWGGDFPLPATRLAGYAPAATMDFEDGAVPTFLRTQSVYGGYNTSDWGTGGEGSKAILLFVTNPGELSYLELDVESTGDAQLDVLFEWGLNTDGTGRLLLDGVEQASAIGSDGTGGVYTHHVYGLSSGSHTLRLEVTGGPSGGQSVIAIDSIAVTGTTPTGYAAGWNAAGGGTQTLPAGRLFRYNGDLWLVKAATDNSAAPTDGASWAQLSTHGSSSGGSSGEQHDFGSAGQWTINHSIGRIPSVTVYDGAGNLLLAEVAATSTQVVITFANPTAGTAVLT